MARDSTMLFNWRFDQWLMLNALQILRLIDHRSRSLDFVSQVTWRPYSHKCFVVNDTVVVIGFSFLAMILFFRCSNVGHLASSGVYCFGLMGNNLGWLLDIVVAKGLDVFSIVLEFVFGRRAFKTLFFCLEQGFEFFLSRLFS